MKPVDRLSFDLCQFYRRHASAGLSMALITVLGTEGSTYSKAGSQMLVNGDGDFQGMLSGGCLEGDLALRSKNTIDNGLADVITYDLRGDDDVFGFGVGCEGALRVLIQPLRAESDYEPFASLLLSLEKAPYADMTLFDAESELGVARLFAPRRILILGAGQDADPLITFTVGLGWEVTVSDHRPASIARLGACSAASAECVAAEDIASHFDLNRFDAVIVMSHNLRADRIYLEALAESSVAFIGLLGPPHRKQRVLGEIGSNAEKLSGRLHGPVGKRIGGRGPAAIALEIAAELQASFFADD
jgi:xanthine dehydrogenase accessory factor